MVNTSKVKVAQSYLTHFNPWTIYSPWNSPGQKTGVGSLSLLQGMGLLNQGIKPRSPALQADSLPAEPPGKPKNTGVGSRPSPVDLPNPGIELGSPALQADSLPIELSEKLLLELNILQNYNIQ